MINPGSVTNQATPASAGSLIPSRPIAVAEGGVTSRWLRPRLFVSRAWGRIHGDLRLAIICVCGIFSVTAILPFCIYRLISGQWMAAAIDIALIASISSANVYAWRTGRTHGVGLLLMTTNSIGCLAVVELLGLTGTMWAYTVVLMNFFLAERRAALLGSSVLILTIVIHGGGFESTAELMTFAVTAALVSLYACIFASRTDRQRQQLEHLASQDPLTGAGNRRSMEAGLNAMLLTAKSSQRPCWVVILDLDHFKLINDRHGHEVGDRVLINFVTVLRDTLRHGDRLYRYGGEEFVLLLPDADTSGLNAVLTKIRRQIGQSLFTPSGPVTVSMGVAAHQGEDDWTGMLARADAALYMAKKNGRNCVVFDDTHDAGGLFDEGTGDSPEALSAAEMY